MNDHGTIEVGADHRFVVASEVPARFDLLALGSQEIDRLVVRDAREGALDGLELAHVALEHLEFGASRVEDVFRDGAEEVLSELHVAVEVHERNLGFYHPELGQVSARLAFFCAESWAETITLPERCRPGFLVELSGLGQVGGLSVEVGFKERACALACVGREDRRVDEREAAIVEETTDRLNDRVTHAQDGVLPLASQPQVPMVHQEIGAVLFGRDRVVGGRRQDAKVLHPDLEDAFLLGMRFDLALDFDRALLADAPGEFEEFWAHIAFENNGLNNSRPVPQLEEMELLARPLVIEPALQQDGFPDVLRKFVHRDVLHGVAISHLWPGVLASCAMVSGVFSLRGAIGRSRTRAAEILGISALVAALVGCAAIYPEVSAPVRNMPAGAALNPPPPPNLVYLQVEAAQIPRRTRGGKDWDATGTAAPDPFVVVTLEGRELFRTSVASNTFDPRWPDEAPNNTWMPPDALLEVELWDANPINNRPICVKRLRHWRDWVKRDRLRLDCPGGAEITLAVEPARARKGIGLYYELRTSSIYITRVAEQSPAARAGLRKGDQITSIQGKPVATMQEDEARSLINAYAATGLELGITTPDGDHVLALKEGPIYPTPADRVALK